MEQKQPIQLDVEKVIRERIPRIAAQLPGFAYRFLEKTICQEQMNRLLRLYGDKKGVAFAKAILDDLHITIRIEGEENIPSQGRFTFAGNHPLGGLDGIALVAVFGEKYQSRIKFLVNDLLMNISNLAPVFLPVNKYGKQSKEAMDAVNQAYSSDEQILFFPSGLVSRLQHGKIYDLEWKKAFITKAVQYRRDVIPVYFEGRNTMFFYRVAQIRKRLGLKFNIELIYLPREVFKSENKTFTIKIGKPIPWQTFDKTKSPAYWAEYVKQQVYKLR